MVMWGKRGISDIVATILVILIAVAAIAIIWMAVLPFLRVEINTGKFANIHIDISRGYTYWDSDLEVAAVQLKRGSDEANVSGVKIIFSNEEGSESFVLGEIYVPTQNQAKTANYLFAGFRFGTPTRVSVAPIYKEGLSAREGEITSDVKLPSGTAIIFPKEVFYKYWCKGYDDGGFPVNESLKQNGKIDFPDEGSGFLHYSGTRNCSSHNEPELCKKFDLDDDSDVDHDDFAIFKSNFGATGCNNDSNSAGNYFWTLANGTGVEGEDPWCSNVDFNKNGVVNLYDFGEKKEMDLLKVAICIP